MATQTDTTYAQNLARVTRVVDGLCPVYGSANVLRMRGYSGKTLPTDHDAAVELTNGFSVALTVEPLNGNGSVYSERRVIAPLDAEAHPHC
jgi:hypothetical protein